MRSMLPGGGLRSETGLACSLPSCFTTVVVFWRLTLQRHLYLT